MCISSYHLNRRHDTVLFGMMLKPQQLRRSFVNNLEDVINREVSLEDDIARFQNVLKHARSELDYSVGRGLYMLPSNMLLKPSNQVTEGHNNKIVVNIGGAELGKSVSVSKPVSKAAVSKPAVSKLVVSKLVVLCRIHTLDDHQDEVQAFILAMGSILFFL